VLQPGWKWSTSVKPIVGTKSCAAAHFQYHVSGVLRIRMDDGTDFDARAGRRLVDPPGRVHDEDLLSGGRVGLATAPRSWRAVRLGRVLRRIGRSRTLSRRESAGGREAVRFRADLFLAAAAAALFVPLFVLRRLGPLDFWWWLSLNLVLLIGLGAILDRDYRSIVRAELRGRVARRVALGALSAAVLYAVFWAGNAAARSLLPFAPSGIAGVYGFRTGASLIRIVLLMTFLIGPGEELFWRGLLQRRAMSRFGPVPGFLAAATLYAGVHAAGGNAMLVLAAAVCGLFWGAIYLRTRSVLLVAVSHTLWDLAVFVVFPFR
jgi:uncharacterized protein